MVGEFNKSSSRNNHKKHKKKKKKRKEDAMHTSRGIRAVGMTLHTKKKKKEHK